MIRVWVETGDAAGCLQVVAQLDVVDGEPSQVAEGGFQLIGQPVPFAPQPGVLAGQIPGRSCRGFCPPGWAMLSPAGWRISVAMSRKCRQKVALLSPRRRARASTLGCARIPIGLTVRCMRTEPDDLFAQDSEMGSTQVSKYSAGTGRQQ